MAPRMTWRKEPNETGLAAIGQAPRGAILKVDGTDVARVYPKPIGGYGRREYRGWYWTAASSTLPIPWQNTSDRPVATIEAAKEAAAAYARSCLATGEKRPT